MIQADKRKYDTEEEYVPDQDSNDNGKGPKIN